MYSGPKCQMPNYEYQLQAASEFNDGIIRFVILNTILL